MINHEMLLRVGGTIQLGILAASALVPGHFSGEPSCVSCRRSRDI